MKWLIGSAAMFVGAMVGLILVATAALSGSALGSQGDFPINVKVGDIPPAYLALYQQAAVATGIDWAILAAIGEVETQHGRAQGSSCAVSTKGARGPMQFMPATWANYGAGGDICDPVDAIPAAARYLVASGAPRDYHAAIFAYNHSEVYYQDVTSVAQRYRREAGSFGASVDVPLSGGGWLAQVPGTSFQCDRRIVPDVVLILERYHAQLTACYAPTGHEPTGEHPLGLAVDLVPAPPSSWVMIDQMVHDLGWRESCASSGCADQTHTVFRFIGWNGYSGHGDPAHAGANAHAHLSWSWKGDRGPPATSVKVMTG
jgi:hypothetical protein